MAKNDNAHSMRMVNSINRNIGNDVAKQFEESHPLSKSADVKKKYDWALATCNFLEEHFDLDTIIDLRKECRCNDGKSIAKKILKYMNGASSIAQFVELFNENETFASFQYISERKLHFCYPECYCACVKRAQQNLPKTWCYCTLGNAEGIFKAVFMCDVKVTLLSSILSGDERCVIEVKW